MPTEPREFRCMDDSPLNDGWNYHDEYEEQREELEENIPLENYEMEDE